MQLGDPTVLETSSGEAAAAAEAGGEAIGSEISIKEGGGDEGEKMNFGGGNRWPRQETLALLKIRSDMDSVFRDSSLKGPLWEEVSRKLGELGYHRSAKKCKEKFENVYKYHKRTKENRSGKSEGKIKTYKFFDQLQALENHHQFTLSYNPTPKPQPPPTLPTSTLPLLPTRPSDSTTTTSTTTTPVVISYATTVPSTNPTPPPTTTTTVVTNPNPSSQQNNNNNSNNDSSVQHSLPIMNNLFSSTSTSSSTASDEDLEEKYRKKRKWKEYFRRLTRQVLAKQEEMQKRFLEAIDKREREQVAHQDAWRIQEMARINREHDILVQERSTAAAKDAAVIAFLQKLSGQPQTPPPPPPPPQPPITVSFGANFLQQPAPTPTPTPVQPPPQPEPQPQPQPQPQKRLQPPALNNGDSPGPLTSPSSSRWPKAEVHALIRLRTSMEPKYQENGPKAPLWEDISAGMQRLGYNRSSKRCKEKWENINKYFKKVKESKKQRREDSKTCPYFHELDALYREKSKGHNNNAFSFHVTNKTNEMMMEPLMVQPEQQWRPPPQQEDKDVDKSNNNNNACHEDDESRKREREYDHEEEEEDDDDDDEVVDDDDDGDGDSVEDEGGNRYEIATNKLSSVDTVE